MLISEEKVFETLKQVIDPELFVSIVDLGLVYQVDIEPEGAISLQETTEGNGAEEDSPAEAEAEGNGAAPTGERADIKIEMTMTSPACPAGPQIIQNAKNVLHRLDEVAEVQIKLVMTPPWTPDRMTEDARDQLGIF